MHVKANCTFARGTPSLVPSPEGTLLYSLPSDREILFSVFRPPINSYLHWSGRFSYNQRGLLQVRPMTTSVLHRPLIVTYVGADGATGLGRGSYVEISAVVSFKGVRSCSVRSGRRFTMLALTVL